MLTESGADVTAIDITLGGRAHDLSRTAVANAILLRIAAGEFDAIHIATPCESYSPNHDEALRTTTAPEGVEPMPEVARAYISYHNRLAHFTACAITAATQPPPP